MLKLFGTNCLSKIDKISLQIFVNSPSIFFLYSCKSGKFFPPFDESFCSIDDKALHAVLLEPTLFLKATDNKFLSSTFNS